ncbi:MAG: sigma-70 family RNA polymerase sigma factor [Deltaproteobacteria bacterium]|nr:sigma-70 family RNA polymerase sigma factor [Deltaproteobacteria bacterium]
MLLAILRSLSGPDPGPDEPGAHAEAEALWSRARAEVDPFVRDALMRDVAKAMVRSALPGLRRYCASQVAGAGDDADDLAQRACVVFWERLASFEGRSTLRTFLYGIAFNLCRQHRRDGARDEALEAEQALTIREGVHPDADEPLEDRIDRGRRHARVVACYRALEARDAWLIRMRLVEQVDYVELLPLYRSTFGGGIETVEGLRSAFFRAKNQLVAALERGSP